MNKFSIFLILFTTVILAGSAAGQSASRGAKPTPSPATHNTSITATPAYAEILFRRTELTAELESLLLDYTEDYPRVQDLRLELEILKTESERLIAVKPTDASKLTLALGKLVLGKVKHQVELRKLQLQYKDEHPTVKKAKKMVDVFEAAIKEILG